MIEDITEGIKAYRTYLAVRQHFTSKNYDFFKYNGKVTASEDSFLKRKDRFFFKRIQRRVKKEDLPLFFAANFVSEDKKWIGNMDEDLFINLKRKLSSISYVFENDCEFLADYCDENGIVPNDLIKSENGETPHLLLLYFKNRVTIESIIILDECLRFLKYWSKQLDDPLVDDLIEKIGKYKPFIKFDKKKSKEIIKTTLLGG